MTPSERETILLLSDDGLASISTNSPLWRKRLVSHLGKPSDSERGWAKWELSPDQFVMPKRAR